MLQHYHTQGIRFTMASSFALMVTFLILLLMRSLINGDDVLVLDKSKRFSLPPFIRVPVNNLDIPAHEELKPARPEEQPPIPKVSDGETIKPEITVSFKQGPGIKKLLEEKFPVPLVNTGLISIVDMQPVYPQRAIASNIQGYVVVEFTVTETGSTDEIKVLEAYPGNIFNRAAIKAASKSLYKPKIVDGKAVAVTGMRKKYTFEFDE